MRFSTAAIFSTLAAFAAAYTQPDYSKPPTGNPITFPGLNEQVPEGAPYEIKWNPTLGKRVSLVLVRGPSSNVQPLETIVENIPNSGHYTWTPGTNLTPDTTHYGLLLVVEGTGAYQWSTQFGISKPVESTAPESTPAASRIVQDMTTTSSSETTTHPAPTHSSAESTVMVTEDVTSTTCPEQSSSAAAVPSTTVHHTSEMTATSASTSESETTAAATVTTRMPIPVVSSAPTTMQSSRASTVTTIATVPAVTPSGTAEVTPTPSPAFNSAGRNVISLGAVAAGIFAVLAL